MTGMEHSIRAVVVGSEERGYHPYVKEGELVLEFSGRVYGFYSHRRKMWWCTCDPDRRYRKEETVLRHLRDAGALDEKHAELMSP